MLLVEVNAITIPFLASVSDMLEDSKLIIDKQELQIEND
jgi:hypothetical protein